MILMEKLLEVEAERGDETQFVEREVVKVDIIEVVARSNNELCG